MLDRRSFACAVQYEERAHNAGFTITKLKEAADFDAKLCFSDEDEYRRHYEEAAKKFEEAERAFNEGCAEFFAGYARSDDETEQDIINNWMRRYRAKI